MNISKQSQTIIDTPSSFTDDSQVLINRIVTDNIDIWTSAIKKRSATGRGSNKKIELTGIKKLRELILEFAVRGRLVPQNPSDEPASKLFVRINDHLCKKIEKDELPKFKRDKSVVEPSDYHSEIPKSWIWCELQDIVLFLNGKAHEQYVSETPGYILINSKFVSNSGKIKKYATERLTPLNEGDIAMVMSDVPNGRALARCYLVETDELYTLNQRICGLTTSPEFNKQYLKIALNRHRYLLGYNDGKKQTNLKKIQVMSCPIALSPLAEQHRIVTKVDELMRLCDQLEQQTEDSITAHQTLVETLLATLSNSETPAAFKQNWIRIAAHFDTLFTTEHSIDQLKQTILQLAVMGKLVPQNPKDEPASVLLEKIAAEKEQLIKDKKIKKQKPLPAITEDEKPFELPIGWEWSKFGLIAEFINGDRGKNYPNKSEYVNDGVPWINTGHIRANGYLTSSDMNFITKDKYDSLRGGKVQKGDLVYCLRGATFGKTAFVEPYNFGAIASSLMIIRPYKEELNSYIYRYLISPFGKSQIFRFDNGSAQPNLSANSVMLYAFPIPPLSEQHRIVKKVDELITLCDQLKTRINDAQTTQLHLADAIVEQAVN